SGTSQPVASSRSRMPATAAAASAVFTVMRTSSEPACASSSTCFAVACASAVSVFVIDCTTTGAPPPMATSPTRTWRVFRRAGAGLSDMALRKREACDLDLDVRREVERPIVVDDVHRRGVADHDGERWMPEDHAAAAPGVELRHERLAFAIADLHPG